MLKDSWIKDLTCHSPEENRWRGVYYFQFSFASILVPWWKWSHKRFVQKISISQFSQSQLQSLYYKKIWFLGKDLKGIHNNYNEQWELVDCWHYYNNLHSGINQVTLSILWFFQKIASIKQRNGVYSF